MYECLTTSLNGAIRLLMLSAKASLSSSGSTRWTTVSHIVVTSRTTHHHTTLSPHLNTIDFIIQLNFHFNANYYLLHQNQNFLFCYNSIFEFCFNINKILTLLSFCFVFRTLDVWTRAEFGGKMWAHARRRTARLILHNR